MPPLWHRTRRTLPRDCHPTIPTARCLQILLSPLVLRRTGPPGRPAESHGTRQKTTDPPDNSSDA
eukprot:858200-Rhodomonas_salina.1